MLGIDPTGIAFNVYRSANGGAAVKLNSNPITATTNYIDTTSTASVPNAYTVRPVINGVEQAASAAFTLAANTPAGQYVEVPVQQPPGGTTPSGEAYTYSVADGAVGDLDGDGEYEIVFRWAPSNSKDPSQDGYTGPVFYDAYKLNGTRLWRISMGKNVRAGPKMNSFVLYDLDGDGKAEFVTKTADGTWSGTGTVIGDANIDYRNANGRILTGPEYLTVFNGQNGSVRQTVNYEPARGALTDWGDDYGNRSERYQDVVAYLDGTRPSFVTARGEYVRIARVAWDFRNGALTKRWTFDSATDTSYNGTVSQQIKVADVDADGRDEIVNGSSAINDNGAGLWVASNPVGGDGDAHFVGHFLPDRPGLQNWLCLDSAGGGYKYQLRDVKTGAFIWGVATTANASRTVAADIDPNHRGYEFWGPSTGGILDQDGAVISTVVPSLSFVTWWDADLSREILDSNKVNKWNGSGIVNLFTADAGFTSVNGSKTTPVIQADIFGDWREEFVLTDGTSRLRIYSTVTPATNRLRTLMHDSQYRVQVAAQQSGSNQAPNPSFYLGTGMSAQPIPSITYVGGSTMDTYQAENATLGGGAIVESINAGFVGAGYVNPPGTGGTISFGNVDGNGGGSKTITIRYANGGAASRTGQIVVNGGTAANITFPTTGGWTTWANLDVTITLNNNATNSIRLQTNGNDLANIDQLTVP